MATAIAGGLAPFLKAQGAACEKDTYTKDDAQALANEVARGIELIQRYAVPSLNSATSARNWTGRHRSVRT